MDIAARNLGEGAFYIKLKSDRKLSESEAAVVIELANDWLKLGREGTFDEPYDTAEKPKYDETLNCVYFKIDLGFMDIESSLDTLEKMCDALNDEKFNEEVLTEIELNGLWEE